MKSVLVVDDCQIEHFVCHDLMESIDESIPVLVAYDGAEALNIVQENQPHLSLILLDINMPGMNGFDFLKEYEACINPNTAVAMLTSSNTLQDRETALSHSCVKAFLQKPLDESVLSELLEEIL